MVEFRRNKKTGILEVWKDGKKSGEVFTMGDDVKKNSYGENGQRKKRKKK